MSCTPTLFLAANTCAGFRPHFETVYEANGDWKVFFIKGGPGTGKSWLLRQVAAAAEERREQVILCPCSSDPDSLDAVVLPGRNIFVCDCTSPHTVEPKLPGACENLVDLGAFWDSEKLFADRARIAALTAENRERHRTAARLLSSAQPFFADRFRPAQSAVDEKRINGFADRFCENDLPQTGRRGRRIPCFLQSVTPNGLIGFAKTVTENYRRILVLDDRHGAVADALFSRIAEQAVLRGYTVWTAHDPFLPDRIAHLLLPELSAALVRESDTLHFETPVRRSHARRFCDVAKLHADKERMRLDEALGTALTDRAAAELQAAKTTHDLLEARYHAAMDFDRLSRETPRIVAQILA